MADRKFYRNVITVEILSAHPWEQKDILSLDQVEADTFDGDSTCYVDWTAQNEQVSPERMRELLRAQGADPDFLEYPFDDASGEYDGPLYQAGGDGTFAANH